MKNILILGGFAVLAASASAPALAKPGKGHGNHHANMAHGGGCPPGLVKKNNGCLPPGQAKKMYNVGQRLPYGYSSYTPYNQIPYDLRNGYDLDDDYRYIYRDDYLYQVDPTTLIVQRVLQSILR